MTQTLPSFRAALVLVLALLASVAQAQQTFNNPDRDVNQRFPLNRVVTGPDGEQYRVRGDLHVTLHTEGARSDAAVIRGEVNPQGVTVEQINGRRSYRVVGSETINRQVEQPRERASRLSQRLQFGLVGQGGAEDLGLVILLGGHMTRDGGLVVRVDDLRLHDRDGRFDRPDRPNQGPGTRPSDRPINRPSDRPVDRDETRDDRRDSPAVQRDGQPAVQRDGQPAVQRDGQRDVKRDDQQNVQRGERRAARRAERRDDGR